MPKVEQGAVIDEAKFDAVQRKVVFPFNNDALCILQGRYQPGYGHNCSVACMTPVRSAARNQQLPSFHPSLPSPNFLTTSALHDIIAMSQPADGFVIIDHSSDRDQR